MSWKRPPARVKQYDGEAPDKPRAVVERTGYVSALGLMFGPHALPPVPPKPTKSERDQSEALGLRIRESARGEACTVRLVGVCSHDPAQTIWSHARWGAQLGEAGRGMATKAIDLAGAYCCTACDAAFDGQVRVDHLTRDEIDRDWMLGHLRSLGILARKGLV